MRTRKRAVRTPHAPSAVSGLDQTKAKRSRLSNFSNTAHFADELRQQGFGLLVLDNDTSLSIAAEVLQDQLKTCSQQPEQAKFPGYRGFAHKQRLEYQAGNAVVSESAILQQLTTKVVQKFNDIAREVLAQIAEGLNLPWNAFESLLGAAIPEGNGAVAASILDTVHYMAPVLDRMTDADKSANCEAHVDKGLLTLVFPDTVQGLQVLLADGSWHKMSVPKNNVAVLTGYTLERATCGLVKAVTHRVVMGNGGCLTARHAIAYKLRAADSAVIDVYPAISLHHNDIPSRFKAPVGVQELMHFFDATHRSINALHENVTAAAGSAQHNTAVVPMPNPPQSMLLRVKECNGYELVFKVLTTTPFLKVMRAYALKQSISLENVRFMCGGRRLDPGFATCGELELNSEDVIYAFMPPRD